MAEESYGLASYPAGVKSPFPRLLNKKDEERWVHPDCINASNPHHECVAYCLGKITESTPRSAKLVPVGGTKSKTSWKDFLKQFGGMRAQEILSTLKDKYETLQRANDDLKNEGHKERQVNNKLTEKLQNELQKVKELEENMVQAEQSMLDRQRADTLTINKGKISIREKDKLIKYLQNENEKYDNLLSITKESAEKNLCIINELGQLRQVVEELREENKRKEAERDEMVSKVATLEEQCKQLVGEKARLMEADGVEKKLETLMNMVNDHMVVNGERWEKVAECRDAKSRIEGENSDDEYLML